MDLNGSLFDAINDLAGHSAIADDLMKFAAQYLIFGVFALVVASWFVRAGVDRGHRLAVYSALLTGAVSFVALGVIHRLYTHPRPFVDRNDVVLLIQHSRDSSFPSDHATAAFALAAGVAVYRRGYGALLLALAAIVSFARVYTGLHYPFDVLSGAAIGVTVALVMQAARPMLQWLDRAVVLRVIPAALR